MDGCKSKRQSLNRKAVNKKNNLLVKLQKIFKKREKGEEKKEVSRREHTIKKMIDTHRVTSHRHKPTGCRLGKGPMRAGREFMPLSNGGTLFDRNSFKGRQTCEGMFLKGLRSQFINRGVLNEANEARKNEDIYKIIDIGRVMVNERPDVQEMCWKSSASESSESGKQPSIFDLKDSSNAVPDFEQCPLSPISFKFADSDEEEEKEERIEIQQSGERKTDWNDRREMIRMNFPTFEAELKRFSLKYEETVGSEILERLPKNGVLENALRSLREILRNKKDEAENEEAGETDFVGFLRKNTERFKEEDSPMTQNEAIDARRGALFLEESPEHDFICMHNAGLEEHRERPSPFFPAFDEDVNFVSSPPTHFMGGLPEDNLEDFHFARTGHQSENFDNALSEFSFNTPPIQYYRRNMF